MENSRAKENGRYGWVALFRSIRDHWIWEDPIKFQWFVDILFEVNHTPKKVLIRNTLIMVKRGEVINSLGTWAKRWGVGKTAVRSFLKLLESDTMIERIPNRETTHLSICNYDSYQGVGNATKTRPKRDPNTNNKGNKGNNIIPRVFYDCELSNSNGDENYKKFVATLYGENEKGEPLDNILSLRDQMTYKQFQTVYTFKEKHGLNLHEYLIGLDNWKTLSKKNTSFQSTILAWMRNDLKKKVA